MQHTHTLGYCNMESIQTYLGMCLNMFCFIGTDKNFKNDKGILGLFRGSDGQHFTGSTSST